MDSFLLELQNTSDSIQSFDLFDPSVGGTVTGETEEISYVWTIKFEGTDYYNDTTGEWQPGNYGWAYAGTIDPAIGSLTPMITIAVGTTTNDLVSLLNAGDPGIVGEWNIKVVNEPPKRTDKSETPTPPGTVFLQVYVRLYPDWTSKYLDTSNFEYGSKYFLIQPSGPGATLNLNRQSTLTAAYGGGVVLPNNKTILVSSGSPNFSYTQFTNSIIQRTYDVHSFEVYSSNQNQLLEPFLFDRKLATGRVYQKVLAPTIDPYQNQNYLVTPKKQGYVVDGFTALKYTILPYESARVMLNYTYLDVATPLLVTKRKPPKPKQFAGDEYSNQGGPFNTIPCWGCVGGQIQQHGTLGGPTGFTNANVNGVCGQVNGDTYYNSPTHPDLLSACANPPNNPNWTYSGTLNPNFTTNITNGYTQFGCKFLAARLAIQEGKLANLVAAGTNPQWQELLKDKIAYIKNKMQTEGCNFDDIPQFSQMSELYKPRDLFVPTNDFIQHQIDIEQGAEKLLNKNDFPMDPEHNF